MWLNEWIIDGDNADVVVLNGVSENDTSNSAETVDTDLDWCHDSVGKYVRIDCQWVVDLPLLSKSSGGDGNGWRGKKTDDVLVENKRSICWELLGGVCLVYFAHDG